MAEPWEAGPAWADWVLIKVGMTEDEAAADLSLFKEKARGYIRRRNKSGFRDVFLVGERWQAKPYVKPGDQRSAGYFDTKEQAADEILAYLCSGVPPPTPKKGRSKRGEGRRPPPKQQKAARQALPATPLAELPAQPITPATFAPLGMYTAPVFDEDASGLPEAAVCPL